MNIRQFESTRKWLNTRIDELLIEYDRGFVVFDGNEEFYVPTQEMICINFPDSYINGIPSIYVLDILDAQFSPRKPAVRIRDFFYDIKEKSFEAMMRR